MVIAGNRGKGIACIVASAFGFALMAFFVRLCDDFGGEITCFQKSFFRNALDKGGARWYIIPIMNKIYGNLNWWSWRV